MKSSRGVFLAITLTVIGILVFSGPLADISRNGFVPPKDQYVWVDTIYKAYRESMVNGTSEYGGKILLVGGAQTNGGSTDNQGFPISFCTFNLTVSHALCKDYGGAFPVEFIWKKSILRYSANITARCTVQGLEDQDPAWGYLGQVPATARNPVLVLRDCVPTDPPPTPITVFSYLSSLYSPRYLSLTVGNNAPTSTTEVAVTSACSPDLKSCIPFSNPVENALVIQPGDRFTVSGATGGLLVCMPSGQSGECAPLMDGQPYGYKVTFGYKDGSTYTISLIVEGGWSPQDDFLVGDPGGRFAIGGFLSPPMTGYDNGSVKVVLEFAVPEHSIRFSDNTALWSVSLYSPGLSTLTLLARETGASNRGECYCGGILSNMTKGVFELQFPVNQARVKPGDYLVVKLSVGNESVGAFWLGVAGEEVQIIKNVNTTILSSNAIQILSVRAVLNKIVPFGQYRYPNQTGNYLLHFEVTWKNIADSNIYIWAGCRASPLEVQVLPNSTANINDVGSGACYSASGPMAIAPGQEVTSIDFDSLGDLRHVLSTPGEVFLKFTLYWGTMQNTTQQQFTFTGSFNADI